MKTRHPIVPEDLLPQRRGIPFRADPDALAARSVETLTRAIIAEADGRINKHDAMAVARERWADDPLVPLMLRAAVLPNALPSPALGTSIVSDLLAVVGATGAGARLLQSGLTLTFDQHAQILVPGLLLSDVTPMSFVGQSAPIPVIDSFTSSVTLTPFKMAAIVAVTAELLAASNAERIVGNALSRAVALSPNGHLMHTSSSPAVSTL